jgi:2,3-bisphosphoglycerate-dependent phosphoglycerate mutase
MADHAIPLSSEGEKQAIDAGEEIARHFRRAYGLPDSPSSQPPEGHYCRIWTSPYLRARQTSELIKAHSQGFVTDIRENILLVEQQFGLFEGADWYSGSLDDAFPRELEFYQKAAAFGGRFWAQVPLGESRFQVCQRVYLSFGTLHRDARRHGINNVIIVSHGVTLRSFMQMWLHLTPEWFEEEPNPPNASIRVIDDCVDKGCSSRFFFSGGLKVGKFSDAFRGGDFSDIWPPPAASKSRKGHASQEGAPSGTDAVASHSSHQDLSTSTLLNRKFSSDSSTKQEESSTASTGTTPAATAAPVAAPCADDPHADGSDLLLRKSQSITKELSKLPPPK